MAFDRTNQLPVLSWRIPNTGDPRLLRLGLAQVGLATIVAALVLVLAAPREWLGWALAGLIPLAIFVAYHKWNRYQRSLAGPDNVRIDDAGLHWLDAAGKEHSFHRGSVAGYRIAREQDTLRPVPALTLYLAGGLESQPLELHPPATPELARQLLGGSWGLEERAGDADHGYDVAIDVYSECHDDYQEWHWEGTRAQLAELFDFLQRAADELPPPQPGTKPAQRVVLARRRQPLRLRIAHSPLPLLEYDLLAAPAAVLRGIAVAALGKLRSAGPTSDHKFDVTLEAKNVWTFHLHVVEPK